MLVIDGTSAGITTCDGHGADGPAALVRGDHGATCADDFLTVNASGWGACIGCLL
jgi:hypothetical protein